MRLSKHNKSLELLDVTPKATKYYFEYDLEVRKLCSYGTVIIQKLVQLLWSIAVHANLFLKCSMGLYD